MASAARVGKVLTLEDFLKLPEQKPVLEYIDGQVKAKAVPQFKHSRMTRRFVERLDEFAEPAGLGGAFPELRCTFDGRSIVPDVVFVIEDHIPLDANGDLMNENFRPPDIHIEIISPDKSVARSHEKLVHATSHGYPLGWLIDPERKTIDVYRPGLPPERLATDGVLEGEPVLPGFRLPVTEVFGWLRRRKPAPGADPA